MSYGRTEVLRGVDVTVSAGEVVALLGPSGAGKSTTIKILEEFRVPSEGRVRVLGEEPVAGGERWRARIGVVLQSWRDHGRWRVRTLLAHLGAYYAPCSTPDRCRPFDVDQLIETVGLSGHGGQRVNRLSGGQRRRLDVAIGIVGRPGRMVHRGVGGAAGPAVHPAVGSGHRVAGDQPAGGERAGACAGRRAHRRLGHLLPDLGDGRLAAGPGPGLPGVLAGPRHAFGAAARRGRRRGDRRLAAALETLLVLVAWSAAGLLCAPPILRRMARRESGSAVKARRDRAMRRIG